MAWCVKVFAVQNPWHPCKRQVQGYMAGTETDCGSFLAGQFRKRAKSRLSEELCLKNESENSRGGYLTSASGAHMCMHW